MAVFGKVLQISRLESDLWLSTIWGTVQAHP